MNVRHITVNGSYKEQHLHDDLINVSSTGLMDSFQGVCTDELKTKREHDHGNAAVMKNNKVAPLEHSNGIKGHTDNGRYIADTDVASADTDGETTAESIVTNTDTGVANAETSPSTSYTIGVDTSTDADTNQLVVQPVDEKVRDVSSR